MKVKEKGEVVPVYAIDAYGGVEDSSVSVATATGPTVRGSIPSGGKIFRTRSDRLWGPLRLLYNVYRVSFPGECGRGVALTT